MRGLVAALAGAGETERGSLISAVEEELVGFEDDGSWEAMQCWWEAFDGLGALEGGWPLGVSPMEAAQRVRERSASRHSTCGYLEADITSMFLGDRLRGLEAPTVEESASWAGLDRYVAPGVGAHAWVLIYCAMLQRLELRVGDAMSALALAQRALDLQLQGGEVEGLYVALERASCLQELGRYRESGDCLARVLKQTTSRVAKSRSVAGELGDPEAEELAGFIPTIRLALARQLCNQGRGGAARSQIRSALSETEDPQVVSQLHYYAAVAARIEGGERTTRRAEIELALESPALDEGMRNMALLELASVALEVSERDTAAAALARVEESLTGHPLSWPGIRARAVATRSRIARAGELGQDEGKALLGEVRAAYFQFLESFEGSGEGLDVGVLALPERRWLVGEFVELSRRVAPGKAGLEALVEDMFAVRSGGALARSIQASAPTLSEVREHLLRGAEDGLLLFIPGGESTHLFAVDRAGVIHERVASLPSLSPLIEGVWRELGSAPRGDVQDARRKFDMRAASLSKAIFPGRVSARIRSWRRIYLAGAQALGRIPIEVLSTGDGEPLGTHSEVLNLPSVTVGVALSRRPQRSMRGGGLLALVTPNEARDLRPQETITFPAREQERVVRAWGEEEVTWAAGEGATLERLAAARSLSALLIFAHGDRAEDHRRPLCVRIAPSSLLEQGLLFAEDIEALPREAVPPVVVLATCGAAGGELRAGGDDSDSLASSFLRSGAQLAFASAAPLEQNATALLCATFFRELLNGERPAEAIRRARNALRADPRFDHPYYWGTLVPVGWDGR